MSAFLFLAWQLGPYRGWWWIRLFSHASWYVHHGYHLLIGVFYFYRMHDLTPWSFGRIVEGSDLLLMVSTNFLRAPLCYWESPFNCFVWCSWIFIKWSLHPFMVRILPASSHYSVLIFFPCASFHTLAFLIRGSPYLLWSIVFRHFPTHLARSYTLHPMCHILGFIGARPSAGFLLADRLKLPHFLVEWVSSQNAPFPCISSDISCYFFTSLSALYEIGINKE